MKVHSGDRCDFSKLLDFFLIGILYGVGIADEDLKKMRESLLDNVTSSSPKRSGHSSGIAMGNVNQRIRLYFGEHYGVDITSTVGVGTTVILTLPLTCME